MKRRTLLLSSLISAGFLGSILRGEDNIALAEPRELNLDPHPDEILPLTLSDSEWRSRLDKNAFYVLRDEGTERAFSSPLNEEKRKGEFVCAACGLALFKSAKKYDSGTGWPSFWKPIKGHIKTKTDYKMILPRTEYHCARCGSHQGHVFNDGPNPTGKRFCNNGVALKFIASTE